MQMRMYIIPSAEQPSPIIISSLRSYRSASTPAGMPSTSVGKNPSSVTRAMLAALPVCWKMYTPRPKLVRPPPMDDTSSPVQSSRN